MKWEKEEREEKEKERLEHERQVQEMHEYERQTRERLERERQQRELERQQMLDRFNNIHNHNTDGAGTLPTSRDDLINGNGQNQVISGGNGIQCQDG